MERIFGLQTRGGVGSRMRAVLSAIGYAEATNRQLVIRWPLKEAAEPSGAFPCKFSDLYDSPYEEQDMLMYGTGDESILANHDMSEIHFRTNTFWQLQPYCKEHLSAYLTRIKPTAQLQAEIDSVNLPHPVVGLQIRHFYKYPHTAGYDWFQGRCRWILEHWPGVTFFLSTDAMEVDTVFRGEFPCLALPKDYEYDHMGILRACADLHILQKCDWVVGSNLSSFSQLVAILRGGKTCTETGVSGGRFESADCPADATEMERNLRPCLATARS